MGILENDPFYQLTTATPFDNRIEIIDLEDGIFSSKGYTLPPHKEYCFSTDIIRYKLAKMIPNAIYLDSDIYIFDYLKFLDAIQHSKKDAVILFDTQCFYSKNNIFYNKSKAAKQPSPSDSPSISHYFFMNNPILLPHQH